MFSSSFCKGLMLIGVLQLANCFCWAEVSCLMWWASYRLDDFVAWQVWDFSFLSNVRTGSGVHPACYSMNTLGSVLGGKAAGEFAVDYSSPSSAEIKNEGFYTPTSPVCLNFVDGNNFEFPFALRLICCVNLQVFCNILVNSVVLNRYLLPSQNTTYIITYLLTYLLHGAESFLRS